MAISKIRMHGSRVQSLNGAVTPKRSRVVLRKNVARDACYSDNLPARKRRRRHGASSEFYALVAQYPSTGKWGFVSVGTYNLSIYDHPRMVFQNPNPALLDLWRRAVIDGAVTTDEAVDITTLKLVRIGFSVVDASSKIFDSPEQEKEFRKMAALAKLTDKEARMLHLVREKAIQRLHQNAEDQSVTQRILARAEATGEEISFGELVRGP